MRFDDRYDSARPYVASFVILRKGNLVAMLERKNTGWMDGSYILPSGKVEYFEHFTAAAIREAKEEAGVDITAEDLRVVHTVHRHGSDGKVFMDWVDMYFEAKKWHGEPYNAEEEKSERLDWIDLHNLPKNIIPSQKAALEHIAKGSFYSEFGWE